MSRRKGTPCACECDPCGSKKCIKAINNVSGDPNGDFEIKAGNGIGISQSGDNSITIINQAMASSFVAGDNIEINPSGDDLEIRVTDDISVQDIDASGDVNISGDLNITGDIIQQGASYETHAEKVYTTNDYIYMRDGAIGGLAAGDYSGFQVKLYDGVNDGRLVIDNTGTARVGDVGSEQPLLTREEAADLSDGDILTWDANDSKAIGIIDNMVRTSRLNKIGDFYNVAITSAQTVNVGTNWTAVAIYSGLASRGNSISFSDGNKFTINENGVYMIQLTNRHDSGSFGGSGIEYPNGFVEATGDKASEIRTQFITLEMSAGQIITIKQYGDQGLMPGYGALNHCIVTRIN